MTQHLWWLELSWHSDNRFSRLPQSNSSPGMGTGALGQSQLHAGPQPTHPRRAQRWPGHGEQAKTEHTAANSSREVFCCQRNGLSVGESLQICGINLSTHPEPRGGPSFAKLNYSPRKGGWDFSWVWFFALPSAVLDTALPSGGSCAPAQTSAQRCQVARKCAPAQTLAAFQRWMNYLRKPLTARTKQGNYSESRGHAESRNMKILSVSDLQRTTDGVREQQLNQTCFGKLLGSQTLRMTRGG